MVARFVLTSGCLQWKCRRLRQGHIGLYEAHVWFIYKTLNPKTRRLHSLEDSPAPAWENTLGRV